VNEVKLNGSRSKGVNFTHEFSIGRLLCWQENKTTHRIIFILNVLRVVSFSLSEGKRK